MVDFHTTEVIENLAAEIGKVVYIDVAKWHLYLTDAKLHTIVAQQVYPLLVENNLNEDNVTRVLSNISVKIGGGKRDVPLADLLPLQCQVDLMDLLEDFQRQL
ncbi:DUF3181 family protein [Spirulina subsalsa]|uniref:DUF3181 family protein n=1 Tax=Spirulina subsalsa TaxID=54311 RepID=UPI000305107D|nr:DUF3181 family protein [Spirulina subsalsa]